MGIRNARFVERVRSERAALGFVNVGFGDAPPLSALSDPAIATWAHNAARIYPMHEVREVLPILGELSRRLDVQADNSREVFEDTRPIQGVEILLSRLKTVCNSRIIAG
jgi:hypothetical protein